MTTVPAPTPGTPAFPVILRLRTSPAPIGWLAPRVSRTRDGVTGTKRPDSVDRSASYQPTMSAMTWTGPPDEYILTTPLGGTPTITRLGTVWPGPKLTLDASGSPTFPG